MKRMLLPLLAALVLLPMQADVGQAVGYPEWETFQNTSVGGTLPESGQETLYYTVTAEPVKGSVAVSEDGSFLYTPRAGKLGRDSFWYRTVDGEGNLSEESAVYLRILPQNGGVSYEDMRGNPAAYAAAKLSEKGLFTGEQLLGRYCFCPEKPVTRGEFLSICMELSGLPVFDAVQHTGWGDDCVIPAWQKSYVLSARVQGLVTEEEQFLPHEALTKGEALEIAAQTLDLEFDAEIERDACFTREDMALLLAPFVE